MLPLLLVTLLGSAGVRASPACCGGGGPFAETFSEILKENFLLPAGPAERPVAYVITADGERRPIDSRIWTASRRLAARLDVPPEPASVARRGWGEWIVWLKRRARVVTLEATANFLDAFYLHGPPAAALIFGFEAIEHTVLPVGLPLCKFVQGACVYVARETEELRRAVFGAFPGVASWRERVALLRVTRRLRRERRQALRDVLHPDGRDVVVDERPRAPGARALAASCFRSALGTPDPEGVACTEDHAAGLRYGREGLRPLHAPGRKVRVEGAGDPDLVGDDFVADATDRGWAAADVVGFQKLKLDLAREAMGELTERDARSFFRLRRRLTGMRKALNLYTYTLEMRASLGRPRNADEAEVDRRFDQSLTEFLIELDRAIWLARSGAGREPHPFERAFRAAPRRALDLVKAWLARPRAESVTEPLTEPASAACADALEASPPDTDAWLGLFDAK